MEHITYAPVVSKERERLKFVKYTLFFFNVLFFVSYIFKSRCASFNLFSSYIYSVW